MSLHLLVVVHIQVVEENIGWCRLAVGSQLVKELFELRNPDRSVMCEQSLDVSLQVDSTDNSYASEPKGVNSILGRRFALLPPSVASNLVGCEASLIYEDNIRSLLHQLDHSWYKLPYAIPSCCLLLCSLVEHLRHLPLSDSTLVVYLP